MKNILKWAQPIIQAAISLLLLVLLVSSGFLPMKYLGIAVVLVLLFLLISFLKARSDRIATRSLGAVLAVVVCIILIVASVFLHQVMNTLNQVSGSEIQIDNIVVIVNESDPAQAIQDTSGYAFGYFEGQDEEYLEETFSEISSLNGDADLSVTPYESSLVLANALLSGEVDAMICNMAYTALLEDAIADFTTITRIISEKQFESPVHTVIKDAEGADAPDAPDAPNASVDKEISYTEDSYNILISGIDVSGPINTTSRSDVNIIMTVNPRTHTIQLTTTPRDYFVKIPGVSGNQRDKLTHAGVYGVHSSMRTLQNLYGIEIQDYIRINFDSLVQLVDALGGIDVNSEVEFDSGGDNHFVKGINHLNGEQALYFSRTRSGFADGDNQRGRNQMLVLTGIIDKLQSPALLKNPTGVLDVVSRSMQTSVSSSNISKVIAWQLDNPKGWTINRQSVTGTDDHQETFSMPGTELYVMWPDEQDVKNARDTIRQVMKEEPQ